MNESRKQGSGQEEGSPPVFRTWNRFYLFVLLHEAILILLFYLFYRIFR